MKKKQKETAVLYVTVLKSIKNRLKKEYKKAGYTTLSSYVNHLLASKK